MPQGEICTHKMRGLASSWLAFSHLCSIADFIGITFWHPTPSVPISLICVCWDFGCGSGSGPPSSLSCVWAFVDLLSSVVMARLTFGTLFYCVPFDQPYYYLCGHQYCCLLCWVTLYIFIGCWPLAEWSPLLLDFVCLTLVYGVVAG